METVPTAEGLQQLGNDPFPNIREKVFGNLRVLEDLCVHGEAWKLGGSPNWRVLSDARAKEVLSDFENGSGTLRRVQPCAGHVPDDVRPRGHQPPLEGPGLSRPVQSTH